MSRFYVLGVDRKPQGPFTAEELFAQVIDANTLVARPGATKWRKAAEVKGLQSLLAELPPPLSAELSEDTTPVAERARSGSPPAHRATPSGMSSAQYLLHDAVAGTGGPYTIQQLRGLKVAINGDSLVAKQGGVGWQRVSEVPELHTLLAQAPPVLSDSSASVAPASAHTQTAPRISAKLEKKGVWAWNRVGGIIGLAILWAFRLCAMNQKAIEQWWEDSKSTQTQRPALPDRQSISQSVSPLSRPRLDSDPATPGVSTPAQNVVGTSEANKVADSDPAIEQLWTNLVQGDTTVVSRIHAAADGGSIPAQYYTGLIYAAGTGVEQDYTRAVWYLRLSEVGGDARASTALGTCYALGNGVTRDLSQAVSYFREGDTRGDCEGTFELALMYDRGAGVALDRTQALLYCRKAAEHGSARAMFALGATYETGEMVPKNMSEAVQWYRSAAALGDVNASNRLAQLPQQ